MLASMLVAAQSDTSRLLRAFPVTDYMVELNDSVKLVQVHLPDDVSFREKQLGLIRGVYDGTVKDTGQKGYGRCQLIKGNYYYFAIYLSAAAKPIKQGDLLYTFMDDAGIHNGWVPRIASHFIRLQDVQGNPFYDRYAVFRYWTLENDKQQMDTMLRDIRYTGQYFLENEPSLNQPVTSGPYAGKLLLEVMKECREEDLVDFFQYILARPNLYAGQEWKLSEIFATWLSSGAPTVVKN